MARHRRRHRRSRRFGDPLISMPSFGTFDIKKYNPFDRSVNSTDVAIGAGVGIVGGAAVKFGLNAVWAPASQPQFVKDYIQPITSIAAGVLAYTFLKNKGRGAGILVGSFLTGVVPALFNQLKTSFPTYFAGYGDPLIRMNSYNGLLTASPQPGMSMYAGLLTASPQPGMSMYSGLEDPVAAFVEN